MNTTWHFGPEDDDDGLTDEERAESLLDDNNLPYDRELDFTYSRSNTILQPLDQISDDDGPYGEY